MLDLAPHTRLDAAHEVVAHASDSAPAPCSRMRAGWIVVHSYPQAERWAETNLTRRGYRTYLPLATVRRRDRVLRSLLHTVQVPAFPRYLFVEFPGNWTPVRYCPGVYRIISAAGQPNLAADAVVEAVRSALDGLEAQAASQTRWSIGQSCSLATGPLASMPAIVTQVGAEMATIAVMMLGQLREIAVSLDALVSRDE